MLLPVKPVCEKAKMRADGTSLIFFRYNYNPTRSTTLNSEIAIPPQYWNKKKLRISDKLPEEYGDWSLLNDKIDRQFNIVKEIIKCAKKYNVAEAGPFVKRLFKPDFDLLKLEEIARKELSLDDVEKDPEDVFFQIKQYIEDKKGKVSQATLDIYRNMGEHLKAFEEFRGEPITFKCFNFDFYDRYTHFLAYNYVQKHFKKPIIGLQQNTISKTIKKLKGFVNDRVNRKKIAPINMSFFKSPAYEGDAIYLPFQEIAQIYYTDLSDFPELIPDKNRFVLACLTGLRFSDFSRIQPEDVRDHRIYLRQEKTEAPVVIPLKKEAEEILKDIFAHDLNYGSNSDFNENIKIIGKLAGITQPITFSFKKGIQITKETRPKAAWITSHTGRRSFCTNEFLAGTPVKLIMKISGHKTERHFYRYIRITQEEAASILEKIWAEKNAAEPLKQYLPTS